MTAAGNLVDLKLWQVLGNDCEAPADAIAGDAPADGEKSTREAMHEETFIKARFAHTVSSSREA